MDDVVLMADPRVVAIGVVDSGEPLVDVREALPVTDLKADEDGLFALVRASVLDRLLVARHRLPAGVDLLFVEGYRPPALQRLYFESYRGQLRQLHPSWSADEVHAATSRYVSPPEVAPHCAGAAVDLTLCADEGAELDMGTPVNASPEDSEGACYTAAPVGSEARRHRDLLGEALGAAGLVNYPTEWWHWSFGDRYWALLTEADTARYGPIER